MPTARRRGPYAPTAKRRREITDAALAVVVESGHRSLTTLAVAQRAGISEPGLLYHYPSKEALLVAALERFDERELSHLEPGQALAAAPERAAIGVQRMNVVHLYTALLSEASNADHPAHAYFKNRWRAGREILASDIALLQERGQAESGVDPHRAATWILAAWDGLQSHWLVDPTFDIDVELRMLIDVVLGRAMIKQAGQARKRAGRSRRT